MKSRCLSVLAVVLAVFGLHLGTPSSAHAESAASIAVDAGAGTLPLYLTQDPDRAQDLYVQVKVTGGPVTDVRIEFTGDGLIVNPSVIEVAGPTNGFNTFVRVQATSGGFHPLSATVSSSTTTPTNVAAGLFYSPGGDPLPATGDLTGLTYGWSDEVATPTGDSDGVRHSLLTFLDGDTAFVGDPTRGRPKCRTASPTERWGCLTYRYEKASGLIQIGGVVAKVVGRKLWVSNIGYPGAEADYNNRFLTSRAYFPKAGKRLAGHWAGSNGVAGAPGSAGRGAGADLVLRRNGTFQLVASRYVAGSAPARVKSAGTYRFARPGKLVLRTHANRRIVMTLAVSTTRQGAPTPGKGIWLVITDKDGHGDTFRLKARQ